jgi:hypothetical protein
MSYEIDFPEATINVSTPAVSSTAINGEFVKIQNPTNTIYSQTDITGFNATDNETILNTNTQSVLSATNLNVIQSLNGGNRTETIFSSSSVNISEKDSNLVELRKTTLDKDALIFYDPLDLATSVATINITGIGLATSGFPSINTFINSSSFQTSDETNNTFINTSSIAFRTADASVVSSLGVAGMNLNKYTTDPEPVLESTTTLAPASLTTNVASFNLQTNSLSLQGTAPTEDYVITADAAGKPQWAPLPEPPPTPNLAEVLAVATAGDANNLPISNLASSSYNVKSAGMAANPLKIESAYDANYQSGDILNLQSPIDETKNPRQFLGNYLPIQIGGVSYWIQIYSARPPP